MTANTSEAEWTRAADGWARWAGVRTAIVPATGWMMARLGRRRFTLAVLAGRKGAERKEITAAAGDGAFTMPVVLMVSNGTANAAEVFASALARNKRTTLVGEPTAEGLLYRGRVGSGIGPKVSRLLSAAHEGQG